MITIEMSNDTFMVLNADDVVAWCDDMIGRANWCFHANTELGLNTSEFFSFNFMEDAVAFRLKFGI